MAEVIGFLREDNATPGEKVVLELLENGLPNDFWLYVECPIPTEKIHRFPDFIVVCNFGVIVLEVKDWISIIEFDNYRVKVFQKGNYRTEKNPVLTAREYAIALNNRLEEIPALVDHQRRKCNVPWGYAVVFPNLPLSTITQMRQVWGEQYVLNKDDLEPYLVTKRLKATVPRDASLRKDELQYVRAAINPVVVLENAGKSIHPASSKPAVILDEAQERLVVEPVQPRKPTETKRDRNQKQENIFEYLTPKASETADRHHREAISVQGEISENLSVRLVRGFAGSGKSLVLQQRARYLKAMHPEWSLLVLTYNAKHANKLHKTLKKYSIEAIHFHKVCRRYLPPDCKGKTIGDPDGWVERWKSKYPVVQKLGSSFVANEISWILEMGFDSLEQYLQVERKGRGFEGRLMRSTREEIYEVLGGYLQFLNESQTLDWAQVPHLASKSIREGVVEPDRYNVILIDEAQDFAPSWMAVVKQMLVPDQGFLFLADDPMQSIYRYYSWREKGVPVVGRTRWLRVPYRNMKEIYQAAYAVIQTDEALKKAIEAETGLSIEPDTDTLRHGPKPRLHRFEKLENEAHFIRSEVRRLSLLGYDLDDIIVLVRRKSGVKRLQHLLRGSGITVETFHALKGLEYDVVFLSQMQTTFANIEDDEDLSRERRLVYMAMTRARSELHLCFEGAWPPQLREVLEYIER